jgi:putative Holliday junction resolvase
MKLLGVDFGTKRIGLAVSDEGGRIAFPKVVLPNDKEFFKKVSVLIKEENIFEIVVGDPTNLDGKANPVSKLTEDFIIALAEHTKLPIYKEKEFFTSYEAHGRKGKEMNNARQDTFAKPKDLDASAAALILQRYLDKRNNN